MREASRASVEELAATARDLARDGAARPGAALRAGRAAQGAWRRRVMPDGLREPAEGPLGRRRGRKSWRMAQKAAQLFRDGRQLLIDAGTTTALFRRRARPRWEFYGHHQLHRWSPANSGMRRNRSEVYLLGGRYFGEGQEVLGPLVVEQIQRAAGRPRRADDRRRGPGRQLPGFQCRGGLHRARHDRQRAADDDPRRQLEARAARALPGLRGEPDRPAGDRRRAPSGSVAEPCAPRASRCIVADDSTMRAARMRQKSARVSLCPNGHIAC